METKAHHVYIGLFVIVMFAFLASSVFWLGKFSSTESYNYYNIDFEEAASGLAVKSDVTIKGIPIGRLESIGLHPTDITKVRAIIAVNSEIIVRTTTKASISLQGVSGFGIELDVLDDTAELLVAKLGEELPTINVERSQITQALETVPDILRNVNLLISRLDDVIAQNNTTVGKSLEAVEKGLSFLIDRTGDVDKILKDVQEITKNSIKVSQDVTNITSNVAEITNDIAKQITPTVMELNATIAEYKKLAQTIDQLINAEAGDTTASVRGALDNISKAAESFAKTAESLERIVTSSEPGVNRFTNKGLKDTELLLKEAAQTMRSFNRLIRQIETNPQRFLFGDKAAPKYNPN